MNKTEYLSNVMQEIEAIKKHATKAEVARLDFETFNPQDDSRCIYGQITGDCKSTRAINLIRACTSIVVHGLGRLDTFSNIKKNINGKPTKINIVPSIFRNYFSTLEVYIALKGAKNEQIIQYLKGETKALKL